MFFRKFFWLFGLLLIFGALFATGGLNQYQDGYTQGYLAGQQAAQQMAEGAEGTTAGTPPAQPTPTYPYRGFGLFGFLFKGFVFFLGFMLLFGLMGMLFGRKHWHHRGYKWHKEWHSHGRTPPWFDDDDLKDEPVMKA